MESHREFALQIGVMCTETSQEMLKTEKMEVHPKGTAMDECSLCCEKVPLEYLRTLTNCGHVYCKLCLKRHVRFAIIESRIEVPCPGCPAHIHPADVKLFCEQETHLFAKYEEFSLRTALIKHPDARWCPAPDCGFAVIWPQGLNCPRIKCQRPECGITFCFECKKEWQPARGCHVKRFKSENEQVEQARPCPRCGCLIHKINDGSCNHMHCTMCRAEFCWLCLREINDLHYMSPTGCTFWGKKPWSRKKKLMWQIGSLIGSPVVIAATALVSVPLIVGIVPITIGRKVYKRTKGQSATRRLLTTAAAVTGSAVVSPALAGFVVAVGVPLAIGYTYVMVPKALFHDAVDYIKNRGPNHRVTPTMTADLFMPNGSIGYLSVSPPMARRAIVEPVLPPAPAPSRAASIVDYSENSSVASLGDAPQEGDDEKSSSEA